MASFSANSENGKFTYDISYDITASPGKATLAITSIKVTANNPGWGNWDLTPSLFFYLIPNRDSGYPQIYQEEYLDSYIEDYITGKGGTYKKEVTNKPDYPNSAGSSATWGSAWHLSQTYTTQDAKTVPVTVGVVVRNTTGTLNGTYSFNRAINVSIPSAYTAPTNLRCTISNVTETGFRINTSWTNGTDNAVSWCTLVPSAGVDKTMGSNPAGTSYTYTGLTPNTNYNTTYVWLRDSSPSNIWFPGWQRGSQWTKIAAPDLSSSYSSTTNSITVSASSDNNTSGLVYKFSINNGGWVQASNRTSHTFSNLSPNTSYSIKCRCENPNNNAGTASGESSTLTFWTKPQISDISLSLASGLEHDKINVSVSPSVNSGNDQYKFKINTGGYGSYSASRSTSYDNLTGHVTYTISCIMRNTVSGFESEEVSDQITTWYDPIYSLSINKTNVWFWYLSVNCSFNYQGGVENIVKYEFDIGGQGYQNKGKTNSHSRGSTNPEGAGKLDYNTNYVCKVRITDNHGRTKEDSATFKTLDERPLYVNGVLREVKLIKSDGSIEYITPNLLSVIESDGSVTNMNKIINNDNRTSFS